MVSKWNSEEQSLDREPARFRCNSISDELNVEHFRLGYFREKHAPTPQMKDEADKEALANCVATVIQRQISPLIFLVIAATTGLRLRSIAIQSSHISNDLMFEYFRIADTRNLRSRNNEAARLALLMRPLRDLYLSDYHCCKKPYRRFQSATHGLLNPSITTARTAPQSSLQRNYADMHPSAALQVHLTALDEQLRTRD